MNVFTKRSNPKATGLMIVALTVIYLLVSVAIAQVSPYTAEKSKITYNRDHLSWGGIYTFGETEYYDSYYEDQNADTNYTYYNHDDGNTDKNEITDPVTTGGKLYYGEVTIENKKGITSGTPLTTYTVDRFYSNIDNAMASVPAPIGIEGVTIPVVTTQSTGVYSIVPDKTGTYRIYVYSPDGAPTGVKYALLESYTTNNSYDGQMNTAREFTAVGNTDWYYTQLTVSNLSWSAFAPSVKTDNSKTASTTDAGVKAYSNTVYTTLGGNTTYYPYNEWTVTERIYNTVLAIQFDSSVQLGPITRTGDSLTVTNPESEDGTITAQNIFGESVTFGTNYHIPVFFSAVSNGEASFSGFVDGSGNDVAVTAYTRGEEGTEETLYGYIFEESSELTAGWEVMFAFPEVNVTGASTATLNYYLNKDDSTIFTYGEGKEYTFTANYYEGSVESPISYVVSGQDGTVIESGTLSKSETQAFTVSAMWETVVVTFTSTFEGTTKTMAYTINCTSATDVVAYVAASSAQANSVGTKYAYLEDALMAATSGQYVVLVRDYEFQTENRNPAWGDMKNGGPGYTVKSGVSFVIPSANSGAQYVTGTTVTDHTYALEAKVDSTSTSKGSLPGDANTNKTLTIPDGISLNIAVNGIMAVGGTTNGVEMIVNDHADVYLEKGASISVGGVLSSCGFIYGDGIVYGNSGGDIYVPFTVTDFRGGGYTVGAAGPLGNDSLAEGIDPLIEGETAITPFNRYAFNAIQCKQEISYGADVFAYADLYAQDAHRNSTAQIIGTDPGSSLLALTGSSSYVEIVYDHSVYVTAHPTIGKLHLKVYGDASYGGMMLTVDPGIGDPVSINTSLITFVLPYNFNLEIASGTFKVPNKVSVLPGATITVNEEAVLEVSSQLTIYDGLSEYTAVSTASSLVLSDYAEEYQNATAANPSNCYPSTDILKAAPFSGSGSANLVVNGTLHVTTDGSLGGIIQTNGGSEAEIIFDSGAGTSTETQIGVTGAHTVMVIKSYTIVGATVRTLNAQIMDLTTGKRVDIVPGETYYPAAGTGIIDTYAYDLYYYSGDRTKFDPIDNEPSGAVTQGFWYNYVANAYLVMDGQVSSNPITLYLAKGADLSGLGYYTDSACTNEVKVFDGSVDTLYYKGAVEAKIDWAESGKDDTYYPTVREAVRNAVNTGDRIVVLQDLNGFKDTVRPMSTQDFIFDLNNYTMTYAGTPFMLGRGDGKMSVYLSGGTVTNVKTEESGETVLCEQSPVLISSDQELTLDMGGGSIIYRAGEAGSTEPILSNGGELTVNMGGGTISIQSGCPTAIVNTGTLTINMGGGSLEHITGLTTADKAFRTGAAITNTGTLTITGTEGAEAGGGGLIKTDLLQDNSTHTNYASVIRNEESGVLTIENITLESEQDINSYFSVIFNYNGAQIPKIDHVALKSSRGYGIYNYGGTIKTIENCRFDTSNGINNRNLRENSYTATSGATIGKYGSINEINNTVMNVGQYAIYNGATISEINGGTYTAHPDSAQANTIGSADVHVQGNTQCYTIYNSNIWWFDTALWKRTDNNIALTRTDEYREEEQYRPTIGTINGVKIFAENTSTSADHGYALYNTGGIIGSIEGNTEIKSYVYSTENGYTGTLTTSNYALRNTAGGIIKSISGTVDISATGNYAIYNDGQFTKSTKNTYGDKVAGIQTNQFTTYGNPSEITAISCSGTIAADGAYGLSNAGKIGSIAAGENGLTISANYNALHNSGGAVNSTYEYIRTYDNPTDSTTETKRVLDYVRNLEDGGFIGAVSGVNLLATGTTETTGKKGYYALQNQGYIGALSGVDISAEEHRGGSSYALVLNGDARQSRYIETRTPEVNTDGIYITTYDYHYEYAVPTIKMIDACTITATASYGLRNLGRIEELKDSTITGTQYVIENSASGAYLQQDTVRYYSGTTAFATTKNAGGATQHSYERSQATIDMIDGCTITGTSTYTVYNGGYIGTLQNNEISSSSYNVLYNGGNSLWEYNYNLKDIITVTATADACTASYGLNDEDKVQIYDYKAPTINLIGSGNTISGTYQLIMNLGTINTIDGENNPSMLTSTSSKKISVYSYTGTLDARTTTTPYKAGTAGTAVNADTYLSAYIGTIKNIRIDSNGYGIQNGNANATYLPVIGEFGDGLEILARCTTVNYYPVYNTNYAKIEKISGGVYVATKSNTYAYFNNNLNAPTLISGGDFRGGNDNRTYSIYSLDNQSYPQGYGVSTITRPATIANTDGTSAEYQCYYICLLKPGAGTVTGETVSGTGERVEYRSLAEAIAAYETLVENGEDNVYVVLLSGSDEDSEPENIVLEKDLYLDINGFTLNANFDLDGHTLYGMDSATNFYLLPTDTVANPAPGSITGVISDGTVSAAHKVDRGAYINKHYVTISETDAEGNVTNAQFHRVSVSVTGIQFALDTTANTGYLSFRGTFRGDSEAAQKLTDMGFKVDSVETWYGKPDTTAGEISSGTMTPADGLHVYYTKELSSIRDIQTVSALMELGETKTTTGTEPNVCEGAQQDVYALLRRIKDEISVASDLTEEQKAALTKYFDSLPEAETET